MATHAFWVIVDGTTPTAFRAKDREVLLPTLVQLQRTQPSVALRWFDRGQLWESPLAARDALKAQRRQRSDRKPGWRPGGTHADPRERYQLTRDQKRARFKRRQRQDSEQSERPKPGAQGDRKLGSREPRKPWNAKDRASKPWKSADPRGRRKGDLSRRSRSGRNRGGHGGGG